MQNFKLTYDVDIAFCIDTTGSMQHVIDIVKRNALKLYPDISSAMKAKGKVISSLRIRVIAFRDYQCDGDMAMQTSPFFTLPDEAAQFEECVNLLSADGGGDPPESGLEALAYAIRSDWKKDSMKRRHIIALYTDAAAHALGTGSSSEHYAKGLPKTFEELTDWWGDAQNSSAYINRHAKRLLLFAPSVKPWTTISAWDNTILSPMALDSGLTELEYDMILSSIVNSI